MVDLCVAAGVTALRRSPTAEDFIEGRFDPALSDLGVDSLSLMELCIGIEDRFSVSLSPEAASRFNSLNGLLEEITKLSRKGKWSKI